MKISANDRVDRAEFFTLLRPSFGGKLNAAQVAGIEAILDAAEAVGMTDANHVANVMAQVRRETGGHMSPIKETVMPSHKDKSPSDATVIDRLNRAYAAGKLPWVKTPYWRDGWFGRGPVQVTHRRNYEKVGKAIGVDLVEKPDLALDHRIGAMIAVIGMRDGLFTGKKLADYHFPGDLDAKPKSNPRRIINGVDGSDLEVAKFHRQFHQALESAGWGLAPWPDHVYEPVTWGTQNEDNTTKPVKKIPAPTSLQNPQRTPAAPALIVTGLAAIGAAVATWWADLADWLTFWN